MTYLFLILGAIFVGIFVSKRTAKVTLHIAFLKAVASVCFIITGLFAMVENSECSKLTGALVAVGGVWGLLGDIALDLKYVFKKYEKEYLTAGFSCFGIGHIFYICAMFFAFGFNKLATIGGVLVSLVSIASVFLLEPVLKLNYNGFKKVTATYMAVLGFVVGLAVGYAIYDFSIAALLMGIGFLLFILSDVFLSGLYFGSTEKERTSRTSIVLNHLSYYVAQFFVAASLLFIKA